MSNKYFICLPGQAHKSLNQYKFSSEQFQEFCQLESNQKQPSPIDKDSSYLHLAKQFGFQWQPLADKGHVLYDWKAQLMMNICQSYARKLNHDLSFPVYEVSGSNMYSQSHPVVDSYAKLYGERLYKNSQSKSDLVMSYDSSYPHFFLASQHIKKDSQLPLGFFSMQDCYRYEQSGECMLMFRQRRFYMNDIHPFFKYIDQAFDHIPEMADKILQAAKLVNINYQIVIEVPSEQIFRKHLSQIQKVVDYLGKPVLINILNDNKSRYWIFNMDFKFIDKLGQSREVACIQIDVGNSKVLNISYKDKNGRKQHPVIIHSAIPGGVERFLYMIFDDFKNRCPLDFHPIQVRLIPISAKHLQVAKKLQSEFSNQLRIDIDDREINLNLKIKRAHKELVPNKILIGDKESESQLRQHLNSIKSNLQKMSNLELKVPILLSQRLI